ncbi:MAG: hypothetical protein HY769_00150 [Candidatus Stahlbacteria bacterium]|nr:hypothetical protein [Candidatus Stahlbacteria bacterium]
MISQLILILAISIAEYRQVSGVIHINTNISNGLYSIEDIAKLARSRDISVVIYTDHFLERFTYGLPPFRNLIKKTIRRNCIVDYGIEKYLAEIKRVSKLYPDMVLIPGAKVRPFYYWTGSYFDKTLTLCNAHRRLLVIGLESLYKNLPIIGNRRTLFNQYNGDVGIFPYQQVIDYVASQGGLCFWSLPEATTDEKVGRIRVLTPPYPTALLETKNYTGFGGLYEGYREAGGPGGTWDKVLNEYCTESRANPVWTIGELDYHYEGEAGGKSLEEVQTVFLVSNVNDSCILDALRQGRMYAMRRTKEYALLLDEFSVSNDLGISAVMGEEICCKDKPIVRFKVLCSDSISREITIKLIRRGSTSNGEIVKKFNLLTPVNMTYIGTKVSGSKSYYRLDIETQYPHKILTNPIFVSRKP